MLRSDGGLWRPLLHPRTRRLAHLRWRHAQVAGPLAAARLEQGRLIGHLEALGFKVRDDAVLRAITDEVVKSSEIEGERLDAEQVRSSVARRLGLDVMRTALSYGAPVTGSNGAQYVTACCLNQRDADTGRSSAFGRRVLEDENRGQPAVSDYGDAQARGRHSRSTGRRGDESNECPEWAPVSHCS